MHRPTTSYAHQVEQPSTQRTRITTWRTLLVMLLLGVTVLPPGAQLFPVVAASNGYTTPAVALQAATTGWNVVVVDDSTNDVGVRPSIAINPVTQRPAISYYDRSGGALRLAQYTGAGNGNCTSFGWKCAELDGGGHAGEYNSLAFRADGGYDLAYTEPDSARLKLRYATLDTTGITTILKDDKGSADGGNDRVLSPSIAYLNGEPYIAYHESLRIEDTLGDFRASGVYGITPSGGTFTGDRRISSDEDASLDVGLYASIDVGQNTNTPRAVYRGATNQHLRYWEATNSPTPSCVDDVDPPCVTVDPTPKTGYYITLKAPRAKAGGGFTPTQIAYYDGTHGQVKYAKYVGGSSTCGNGGAPGWQCVVIDSVGNNSTLGVSMALDSQGNPVIAYYDFNDEAHGVLKLARYAGNEIGNCGPADLFLTWKCVVVDDGGTDDVGQFASLAIDADNKAYIAYYNATDKALMLAHEKSDSIPTLTKSYTPATIDQDATTTLKLTLKNNLSSSLTGVSLTNNIDPQLIVKNGTLKSTCGGSISLISSFNKALKLGNGSLGAQGSCEITAELVGMEPGTFTTPTGELTSNEANPGTSVGATLKVLGYAPTVTKSFAQSTLTTGQSTKVTYTIKNNMLNTNLTGLLFYDVTHAHSFDGVPDLVENTCGGTVSAYAFTAQYSFKLVDGTLAKQATCTLTVQITAKHPGVSNDATDLLTSNEAAPGAPAQAQLVVQPQATAIPTATTEPTATASAPAPADPTATATSPTDPTATATLPAPTDPTATPGGTVDQNSHKVYLPIVQR